MDKTNFDSKEIVKTRDEGIAILLDYLAKTCVLEGCDNRTSRRGQPCHVCMQDLGVGG